ncbi:ShlB/FhaC/HecB family hemolysin secretion/activation protein [Lyngbya confervoides]|uniref:Hemolysin activation/secretion protein n=1 Tax=Lyngbya confervoides BDU141951 TaxID=1574623 RepID=A0ABD4TA40_9CYAN|nr:ShlB/FhaC/HecB family hemolysin secretion/activation protein [Lyngbya confervoides]MCM1985260.1 hypothetical protein [Lyngbya confervoides BDU141951]
MAQVNLNQDDPGRIEEQIPPPSVPPPPADIQIPDPDAPVTPPPGSEDETFELKAVKIEGVTVYRPEDLAPFYRDRLNQPVSLRDLYAIAQAITERYQQDGYLLSLAIVPEQTIRDGEVTLQVVEGYVASVEFEEAPKHLRDRLNQFGHKITSLRPLNVNKMERTLLLANDLAGVEIKSILKRGEQLGTAILLARVLYDSFDPFGELTNRGSDEVGPLRLQVGTHLNSLLGQGERITLRGVITPADPLELALGSLDVTVPVGTEGLQLEFGGSYTEVNPGGVLERFDINGRTFALETGLSYPVIRSRTFNVAVQGGFDYAGTRNISDLLAQPTVLNQDRLAVLRAGVEFDRLDASGRWAGGAELSQGIAGTTPGNAMDPLSRAQGSAVFTKANVNLERLQQLPAQFYGLLQARAQITGDALLVREQFGLGGAPFGSGFDPSELLGDYGYGLRAELQRPLQYQGFGRVQSTTPYLFADHGQIFRNFRLATENSSDSLTSAGLGVRHFFGNELNLTVEVAFPLDRTDQPTNDDPRLFFSLTGIF